MVADLFIASLLFILVLRHSDLRKHLSGFCYREFI
jgi:hypothetical protein